MKRTSLALALILMVGALSVTVTAAEKPAPSGVTLKGEIVDLACYLARGGKGPEHATCAAKCAEMGQPIGLAASDGKTYLLMADHADTSAYAKAKSLAGSKVEIQGQVAARDGMNGLTVLAVKTL